MSDDMVRYRALVMEATGGFNPTIIMSHLILEEETVKLVIPVEHEVAEGVVLEQIFMGINLFDPSDDLGLGADVTKTDPGNEYPVDDESEDMFDAEDLAPHVKNILVNSGFSTTAANGISINDVDRYTIWYDAPDVSDEIKKAIETHGGIGLILATKHGFDRNDPDNEVNKKKLIRWMLSTIKDRGTVPWAVMIMADELKHKMSITWPELDSILRSYVKKET